jgi:hypothetical protein
MIITSTSGAGHAGAIRTPAVAKRRIDEMEIKRAGSQSSTKGPADYFTGTVRIDMPFQGTDPARVGGAIVTFEPGARTAWHRIR